MVLHTRVTVHTQNGRVFGLNSAAALYCPIRVQARSLRGQLFNLRSVHLILFCGLTQWIALLRHPRFHGVFKLTDPLGELALFTPDKGGFGGEEEVERFQTALIGLGIETVDDRDGDDLEGADDEESVRTDV